MKTYHTKTTLKIAAMAMLLTAKCADTTIAQTKPKKQTGNVWLANVDDVEIPLKTILANPMLVSKKDGCEVTDFIISFLPKDGEFFGPFRTKGNMINENQLNFLKEFKGVKVKIFIETVRVKCIGKDTVIESPVIVTSMG
jgi:hypothetical protein